MLNFRDPAIVLRIVIVVFSGLSAILMIAGTAVDEYVQWQTTAMGCQKVTVDFTGFSFRAPFKYMHTLSFFIILTTSVICLVQAAATALHVLVLVKGKACASNQKHALIVSCALAALLLAVIVVANVNFTEGRAGAQWGAIVTSKEYQEALAAHASKKVDKAIGKFGKDLERDADDLMRRYSRKKRSLAPRQSTPWGPSYSLLCATFSFAIINLILLLAIHAMSKRGASSFGAFVGFLKETVLDRLKVLRFVITLLSVIILILMIAAAVADRYIDRDELSGEKCVQGTRLYDCHGPGKPASNRQFKDMRFLAIVIFAITILDCLVLAAFSVLSILQLVKNKVLTRPLLYLSAACTILMLLTLIITCINFTSARYYPNEGMKTTYQSSFSCICASFALSIVNTALNALNMFLSKKGEGFGPSHVHATSTNPPSSGGIPSQPSSGGIPSSQPTSK